jgi:parvulin-like peptidyl-prolyl isomerase
MNKLSWVVSVILIGFLNVEAKTVDRILVQVNDDIITQSEFKREMDTRRQELAAKYKGEQLEKMLQQAEKSVLDELINNKLLYQKGMELSLDNNDIENRVSSIVQQVIKQYNFKDNDEFEAELEKRGSTLKEFRENYRKMIIVDDVKNGFVSSRITLLTPEIEKYYKDHIADFTSPEEVTLSELIIEGTEDHANDLYRRLQQGEAFATLVSQYSKGATASKGGGIGTYLISKLNSETIVAITNLKDGDISKPQKSKEGYIIYHIDSRKLPIVRAFAEVREQIKSDLWNKKFEPELERFISQLKEDAYIQIFSETAK